MSVGEASEVLDVHPNTIRNWISSGILRGHVRTLVTGTRKTRVSIADVQRIKRQGVDHAANDQG